LTVLEVLLSVAILLMAMTALMQLMTTGSNLGTKAHAKEEALRFAQSKIAEVASGATSLPANDSGTIEDTDLHWELTSSQRDDLANLWNVTVTVTRKSEDGSSTPFTLSQMVYDPQQRGSTVDVAIAAANTKSNNKSSSSSGSNSSSSPSGSNTQNQSGSTPGPAATTPSKTGGSPNNPSKTGSSPNNPSGGNSKTTTSPSKGGNTSPSGGGQSGGGSTPSVGSTPSGGNTPAGTVPSGSPKTGNTGTSKGG
jgi:hypothetical protein